MLTAVGILSIVFGSLGLLANLWGIGSSAMMFVAAANFPAAVTTPVVAGTTADTTPPDTLAAEDVDTIVAALHARQPLPEEDQRRLADAIRTSEAPFAPPAPPNGWTAAFVGNQILATYAEDYGGGLETHYDLGGSGDIWVRPGEIELFALPMGGGDVTTIVAADAAPVVTSSPPFANPGNSFLDIYTSAPAIALLAVQVVNLLLAGVLLAAGVMTVRDRPRAAGWHKAWAWTRLATAVLAAAFTGWMMAGVFDAFGGTTGVFNVTGPGGATAATTPPAWSGYFGVIMAVMIGVFTLLWGAAYPVAVLIVVHLRGVRAYYANDFGDA